MDEREDQPSRGNGGNGGGELTQDMQELIEDRVARRDLLHLDPTERAQFVHELIFWALELEDSADAAISGYVLWDILCYAVHLIGQYSMVLEDDEFSIMARAINAWLFTMHYNLDDTALQLGPSRDKHIEFWKDQIYEPKVAEEEN